MAATILKKTAGALADSPMFRRGKFVFSENSRNWNLPLSKLDKLLTGGWLILSDYSKGVFPPTFTNQQEAYLAEKAYRFSLPGVSQQDILNYAMTKPFLYGKAGRGYLQDFNKITECIQRAGLRPSAKLLELGCGSGWTAEFLAAMGFDVTGTTLAEEDIQDANRRIESLVVKGLKPTLKFTASPMESVHTVVGRNNFDAVFVYEALHHAFDWRQTLASAHACLREDGWLIICKEPNVLHTCVSYRVAKLSNTHEIGFGRRDLLAGLRTSGFRNIVSMGAKLHCWFRPHWILAQKKK